MQLTFEGSSDVAFARNVALSFTCSAFDKNADRDVVLLVDDDMVFNLDQAREVCDVARKTRCPASAVYPTAISEMAASRQWAPPGKWLAGLGFLAIPRENLLELARRSPSFVWRDNRTLYEFTNSALHLVDGQHRWYGEDYWLCHRLGGVNLLPIAVGHLKTVPLTAGDETLAKVRDGLPLDGTGPRPFQVSTDQGSGLSVLQPETNASEG
jgi:hypothetical protein